MPQTNKLRTAVIGATGYTGLELVYLLTKHPKVEIKYLCATKKLGRKISIFNIFFCIIPSPAASGHRNCNK